MSELSQKLEMVKYLIPDLPPDLEHDVDDGMLEDDDYEDDEYNE